MINYDIPWNPNRLEQRMGRIHRYGQEKDCLITNFVSTNTREGRVLEKLFDRISKIEEDLDPNRTGKVFNVLGDIFPANQLERMLRDMYARNLTEDVIKDRIVEQVDTKRLKRITESALEGLAKCELNLSVIVGKSEEAKERRLVPEVVEGFFLIITDLGEAIFCKTFAWLSCSVESKNTTFYARSHGQNSFRFNQSTQSNHLYSLLLTGL